MVKSKFQAPEADVEEPPFSGFLNVVEPPARDQSLG